MEALVAGDECSNGRLSPPAAQLDGTLRLSGVTVQQKGGGLNQNIILKMYSNATWTDVDLEAYFGFGMYFNTMLPIPAERTLHYSNE